MPQHALDDVAPRVGHVREHPARTHPGPAGEPGGEQHEQRQGQVELLLDREGPEVLHGRGVPAGGEVVHRGGHEPPVLHVEGRREDLPQVPAPQHARLQHEHRSRRHREHEERGRQQPGGAAGPEAGEAEPPGALALADKVAGDEEAADDEEDVDAHVPAGEARGHEVVHEHRADGERTQGLDLGTQRGTPRRRGPRLTPPGTRVGAHRHDTNLFVRVCPGFIVALTRRPVERLARVSPGTSGC